MTSLLRRSVLVAAIAAAVPVVNAAERVDVDRVLACAKEHDAARRLACYDDAVAASMHEQPAVMTARPPAAEPTTPAVIPAPVAAASPSGVNATGDFGIAGSSVARERREQQERNQDDSGKVSSITAEVIAVSSKPHGELVITLDNAQTWMQKRVERHFAVKPGDRVTINAGMLGSFHMSNGNRSTKVTRVK